MRTRQATSHPRHMIRPSINVTYVDVNPKPEHLQSWLLAIWQMSMSTPRPGHLPPHRCVNLGACDPPPHPPLAHPLAEKCKQLGARNGRPWGCVWDNTMILLVDRMPEHSSCRPARADLKSAWCRLCARQHNLHVQIPKTALQIIKTALHFFQNCAAFFENCAAIFRNCAADSAPYIQFLRVKQQKGSADSQKLRCRL